MPNPVADQDLRFAALAIAAYQHNGQTYDDEPFLHHLFCVGAVLEEYGYDSPDMIAAALLHDVIEDTDLTLEELREAMPPSVCDIVWAVTDSTEGKNRRERKANTLAKTAHSRAAVCLKLCDRIANVRASVRLAQEQPDAKNYLGMYRDEHQQFREFLYREGEYDDMWAELDEMLYGKIDHTSDA